MIAIIEETLSRDENKSHGRPGDKRSDGVHQLKQTPHTRYMTINIGEKHLTQRASATPLLFPAGQVQTEFISHRSSENNEWPEKIASL